MLCSSCALSRSGSVHPEFAIRIHRNTRLHLTSTLSLTRVDEPKTLGGLVLRRGQTSTEGVCPHLDSTCKPSNVCKTCATFGRQCVALDTFPNVTIAEYGTVSGVWPMKAESESAAERYSHHEVLFLSRFQLLPVLLATKHHLILPRPTLTSFLFVLPQFSLVVRSLAGSTQVRTLGSFFTSFVDLSFFC